MTSASRWFLLLHLSFCAAWMDERPVLESQDGHLIISSAKDRNITLKIMGSGYLNVNEINLLHVASAAQNATRVIDRWRMGYLAEMESSLHQLTTVVTGSTGLQRRVALLERGIDVNGTIRAGNRSRRPNMLPSVITRNNLRRINMRLKTLEDSLRAMQTLLRENECQSNPCQNGGTCEDLYDAYQCHCTSNWEGPNCMTDVNECARFLGTDIGCQNRATCHNLPGSYRCDCLPGWYGLHCTQKTSICNTENSEELCGEHGACVPKSNSLGYTCICEQGWKSDGTSLVCKDVDECTADHPPCSVNPPVPCRNTRGSFTCGACPHGYSGNGYYCTDIDECLINNGGCSTSPYVQCMNTMGSRVCGSCPSGYRGDGVSCIFVGGCVINNGGCHRLAICTENPSLSSSYVLCRCPSGYVGNGMGPNGCQLSDVSLNTACSSNPCVHGTCVPNGANGFTCTCSSGYSGTTCSIPADPCSPNPCRNSGNCVASSGQAQCQCTLNFTGNRCETPRQTCGGVSRNPIGMLQYPMGGSTYQHGLSCAWVLITQPSKVLNITFSSFSLEQSTDCKFDFLQIHDGRNAGSQMINRFCGDSLPNGNGNIISSHNSLYLWFHSDSSISHDGFTFYWNSIDPVCGGVLEDNYGTITSPGSPGRYPPNRDCFWRISVAESKRIQFHFGQMMLEENCTNDYVEITGIEEERLGLYCNHTRPPPLITPSSEATVHFHSDSTVQDAGFQIHFAAIEGTPGCGGIYTTPTGVINSPGHSSSFYQSNMQCEWKIQLPADERIRASWIRFNLEDSNSCQFDSVEIYDGPNRLSQLLGRYCGSDMPPAIKSSSNTLLVVFISDYSYELEGFTLSYDTLCGGEFHEETGIIKSPFYPETYHGSKTCIYEIIQPPNKGIILTIQDMDIEGREPPDCYYDYIEIFDGDNENATRLAILCGDEEHTPDAPYYSTHNFMYIKFTTDNSIEGRGFKANYTTINRRCGGLLKETSGIIRSPKEDGVYGANERCIWTIQAPPGYVVQLTWISFHLEYEAQCTYDYVQIYESYGQPSDSPVPAYCGTNKPPNLTSQDRILSIFFRTDRSIATDGFVVSYIFVDVTKVCGGRYTTLNGVIKSPNYPNNYPNNKECIWVIEAKNRHRIMLTVEYFKLEKHSGCQFDYLEIRNGGYESAPLIGKFCGTEIPTEIPSQTNQMFIRFVSDFSKSSKGFEIQWDSTTEGCGGVMTGVTGDIISPNYPEPYNANANCFWKISVAMGSLVQIMIMDIDLENHEICRYDFIEIFEGNHRKNGNRYCGSTNPKIIQSKSNQITIRFRSDFSSSGRGFHLKYETQCYNNLRGYYGVIESPNFPNKYEHSTNCSWTIEAPMGNTINLTFSHFDLETSFELTENSSHECMNDYLQIMEGEEDTPSTELGRFCGTVDLPMKVNSTQRQVFIKFITDSSIAFNGFRLEWAINGCGGHLTKPYSSFTSPGYPSAYPTNIDCEWLIEVDHLHSIEITFHEVRTEKRKGCYYDKIQIYSGDNENAPKLTELCYSDKPMIYTSSGNKMFVKFHSDSSYADRGFNASYRSVPIGCGGKFTSNWGVIHSANYPQNYPHAQNCEWLLEIDNNYLVNLTFLDFDVENSRNCSDDYVKIFDGSTKNDPLLGTHCHNQLPPNYVSSGNQMLVVMRSDSMLSAKGFKAQYTRACGARIIVKDYGFITSSVAYTNPYTNDESNCTWILIAENPADHVTVIFTHMEISPYNSDDDISEGSCFWDYIQVYEGEGMDGPSLGQWCNNVIPSPIMSTGSSLTLHLFIRYEFIGQFAVTYSVLNTACGGNYTSERGMITSPSYPNSYPLNAECVWFLNTAPGNKITVAFSEFDIEPSENCDLDYLEVRENSGIGKLISVSCGKDIAAITSSTGLWIKFKSDSSGTAKGFVAEYNFVGGNELEGYTGRVASPLYPQLYKREASFSWRITVEMDSIIRIEFGNLQIETLGSSCFYKVEIFDGYDNEAPTLLKVCGYMLPDPVESSSNMVYITMTTDFVRLGSRFDLTWLQIPKDSSKEENKEIRLSECNKEVALVDNHNRMYAFSSPGWPTGYAAGLHCNWVFTSPPGTHLVLRIISMDLEESINCIADAVSVYSGDASTATSNAHLESRLCLANSTSNLVRASNVMTVKFDSDAYINKTGFNAYAYRDCGGRLTEPNGVIEYNNSFVRAINTWHFTCEWNVTVKPGRTIKVQINEISIEQTSTQACGDNYLLLKNGEGIFSPLLGNGKYCGDVIPPELETTGNHLYVKATGSGHRVRFKLTYREISMNCGGEFVLTNKQKEWEISTPNYPNIPPTYSECTWTATAPTGERLSIHFEDRFDLSFSENCDQEYVEIRDGGTDSSKLMGKYCKDVAPSSMSTIGNMMYIHFYTEVPEPKNGFKAVITSGDVCGGIFRGTNGVIESPNYPHPYPKNLTCSWIIVGPSDHSLKIQFRDIHLPGFRRCFGDHVKIGEKLVENNTISEIGTYCGLQKPDVIETSGNEAYVYFESDSRVYVSYRGFSINFTSSQETCGGPLTAMSGIIKSPGYPNPRTKPRYCDWKITLPMGYQVVVNILDIDIISSGPTRVGYALSFYNDFRFKSKIKILRQSDITEEIRSSSNTMSIGYWSSAGHRGFKLRYTAQAPAPCGGDLRELEGTLTGPTSLPFNQSSYVCQWKLHPPHNMIEDMMSSSNSTGMTMTIKVSGYLGESESLLNVRRNCIRPQYIEVQDIGMLCGDMVKPRYLRSPKIVNELTLMNGTYRERMNFTLQYQWQPCGGILEGPSHTIKTPSNISYPISCAWHVNYPDGETILLSFAKFDFDNNCNDNYIIVRNGGATSPQIGWYCGRTKSLPRHNISSVSNQLWIEYFSSTNTGDFEINLQVANAGCGGSLRGHSREISSPEFPKQYPNNSECTWEIMADNGYHIGLVFIDRFSLETSSNCEKDYVQIFNWMTKIEENYLSGEWQSVGKVCGRNTPTPFNSTSNRMKVVFHSNEAIQSDGFRAVWNENCGGIFQATEMINIILSPSYPNLYPSNAFCNYTIVAPDEDIIVEFTDFKLEGGSGSCDFDNVTIISESMHMTENVETYCGNNKPPLVKSISRIQIIFMTDSYVHRSGYQFKYFLNKCGGIITQPTTLKPLMHGEEYFGRMNCTWIIKAPQGKSILIRFEKFILEFSTSCYFDNVIIYEGDLVRGDKRIALVCGNLTEHLPTFKSESNSMVVNFNADNSRHFEGFTAKVLFTTSPADGCGETINMTSSRTNFFRTQRAAVYQPFEECHWTVETSLGKNIKLSINTMDIRNTTSNNTSSDKCTGDYLEIRDGGGLYAELIGQYCGNVPPLPVVSTSNMLWIRFYSDGTGEGAGANVTLDAVDSLCGLTNRIINGSTQILTSPGYPDSHPSGTQCRWTLQYPEKYKDRLRIQFIDFNMIDSNKCESDYLEITEKSTFINEGFGTNFIYSGVNHHPVTVEMGSYLPFGSYKFCGTELPHDYYSYSNTIQITFKSMSDGHNGVNKFKLEYSTANCDRNYTSEQGRIFHHAFSNCWIAITAPANHTISLYFNQFGIYDNEHCTRNALQVHDGDSSGPIITTLCNSAMPSPIFSTGNKLTLHSWTESPSSYQNYDIIYTTTDAGRGCGGRIFNYGGRFTSPMYPNIYRNNTVCTWDVSVPRDFKIVLRFLVFDIGTKKNCNNNNLKVYDVVPSGEVLRSTYCGEDDPARLEADSNRVLVKYTSTMNNVGTGWIIVFMGQSTTHPIDIIDNW